MEKASHRPTDTFASIVEVAGVPRIAIGGVPRPATAVMPRPVGQPGETARFAAYFRALPAVIFEDVSAQGAVRVRRKEFGGKTYLTSPTRGEKTRRPPSISAQEWPTPSPANALLA